MYTIEIYPRFRSYTHPSQNSSKLLQTHTHYTYAHDNKYPFPKPQKHDIFVVPFDTFLLCARSATTLVCNSSHQTQISPS